jgi:hypothetical protein
MNSPAISPLRAGQVLEIIFAPFTPRITVHSERELTVERAFARLRPPNTRPTRETEP